MPRGRHGEVDHNDSIVTRIDANKKERFRIVCEEDGEESMVSAIRAMIDARIEGRHEEIGQLSETIRKWSPPTDERDAARAHRPEPGQSAFDGQELRR